MNEDRQKDDESEDDINLAAFFDSIAIKPEKKNDEITENSAAAVDESINTTVDIDDDLPTCKSCEACTRPKSCLQFLSPQCEYCNKAHPRFLLTGQKHASMNQEGCTTLTQVQFITKLVNENDLTLDQSRRVFNKLVEVVYKCASQQREKMKESLSSCIENGSSKNEPSISITFRSENDNIKLMAVRFSLCYLTILKNESEAKTRSSDTDVTATQKCENQFEKMEGTFVIGSGGKKASSPVHKRPPVPAPRNNRASILRQKASVEKQDVANSNKSVNQCQITVSKSSSQQCQTAVSKSTVQCHTTVTVSQCSNSTTLNRDSETVPKDDDQKHHQQDSIERSNRNIIPKRKTCAKVDAKNKDEGKRVRLVHQPPGINVGKYSSDVSHILWNTAVPFSLDVITKVTGVEQKLRHCLEQLENKWDYPKPFEIINEAEECISKIRELIKCQDFKQLKDYECRVAEIRRIWAEILQFRDICKSNTIPERSYLDHLEQVRPSNDVSVFGQLLYNAQTLMGLSGWETTHLHELDVQRGVGNAAGHFVMKKKKRRKIRDDDDDEELLKNIKIADDRPGYDAASNLVGDNLQDFEDDRAHVFSTDIEYRKHKCNARGLAPKGGYEGAEDARHLADEAEVYMVMRKKDNEDVVDIMYGACVQNKPQKKKGKQRKKKCKRTVAFGMIAPNIRIGDDEDSDVEENDEIGDNKNYI
ncbi:uncharacterized protein LOC141898825 [Tubulanus polymorphus]|uniref:uncharacterized protein LOC141898825 n=1 Tax=Tubulanus polymorphus TaxID=672921 RepID=UPI003DA50104